MSIKLCQGKVYKTALNIFLIVRILKKCTKFAGTEHFFY